MRRALLTVFAVAVFIGAAWAGGFTTPGSRTRLGQWESRYGTLAAYPPLFAAEKPITLDTRGGPVRSYLFGVGLAASNLFQPGVTPVGTSVDLVGAASGGLMASMSIEGHYSNITLRSAPNTLGMIADTDVGWIFANDGVNTNYQLSFGYYDHVTFTTATAGSTLAQFASVYSNTTVAATGSGTITATDMIGLYAQPNATAGATITNWHGVLIADAAIGGSLLTEVGVDLKALSVGSTLIAGVRSVIPFNGSTKQFFLLDTGGATSKLAGPLIAEPVGWAQANVGGI